MTDAERLLIELARAVDTRPATRDLAQQRRRAREDASRLRAIAGMVRRHVEAAVTAARDASRRPCASCGGMLPQDAAPSRSTCSDRCRQRLARSRRPA